MQNSLVHSVSDACKISCTGRTALYQAINSRALRAVKRGRRTLIFDDDLRGWLLSLPDIQEQSGAYPRKRQKGLARGSAVRRSYTPK
jgi:hypothetical protein